MKTETDWKAIVEANVRMGLVHPPMPQLEKLYRSDRKRPAGTSTAWSTRIKNMMQGLTTRGTPRKYHRKEALQ